MRPLTSGVAALRVFMTADAVGGVWSYALDLAQALSAGGAQVTLAVLGPQPGSAQSRQAANAGVSLLSTGLDLDWTAASADAARVAGSAVARLSASLRPDIVHLHSAGLLAGQSYAAPVVVTCHSCAATWWQAVHGGKLPPQLAWQRDRTAAGYARADALIAPSQTFALATMAAYGHPIDPVVVHNGRASCPIGQSAGEGAAVFTSGRLWDLGKDVATLDAAAALLPWPVVAAGSLDGPNGERASFSHLQALGWLSPRQVADHLAASPIYVTAARYEPFGLGVLEAAQAGCALVLSDLPTFRELWDQAASFVPLGDPHGYAAAITGLMQDPARRAALGDAARARAGRYTVAAMAAGTLAVYQARLARLAA